MGHRLVKDYPHKCRNVHGHEYMAEIEIQSENLDEYDFVVDFAELKEKVKGWIDDNLDHGFICCKHDNSMIQFLVSDKQKIYIIDNNPTAEIIAKLLFDKATKLMNHDDISVSKVKVWETPDSFATFEC